MPRFLSQWNHVHRVMFHDIGEVDEAIPDLTYSIKELREKFVLETEILRGQMARKGEYLIQNAKTDEDFELAFDSPSVSLPSDYDYVDADADKAAVRDGLVRLQQVRMAAAKADQKVDDGSGASQVEPSAGSGKDEPGSKVG